LFERPQQVGERVALVHVEFPDNDSCEDLAEFTDLARSAGAEICEVITCSRSVPDAKYFIGTGKAETVRQAVLDHKIDLLLFNHALSPAQERNLERLCNVRVLDRTGLILDIFAQRARTFEGKLQVELAQCQHMSTRLVRGWTHLERQKGGIGLRGPGETQLETDRRLLRERIKAIQKRLQKVTSGRAQGRQARQKAAIPTVSLVGYTNAGKSSLFNQLCATNIYAADQLFATLDPTLRRLPLASGQAAVLADTVGFIRHLPHDLVAAFAATLEETRDASLLLHVIDISAENRRDNIVQVNNVLAGIDAGNVPQLHVFNKIDRVDVPAEIKRDADGRPHSVYVSAVTGAGMDLLLQAISECLFGDPIERTVYLTPAEGKLRAVLYEKDAVLNEQVTETGDWVLRIRLTRDDFNKLFPEESQTLDIL